MSAAVTGLVVWAVTFGPPAGEQPPPAPAELTAAEKKLAEVLQRTGAALRAGGAFRVSIDTEWKAEGVDPARSGTNHYSLAWARPERFRVEVRSGDDERPALVCASDGRTLTRLLTSKSYYTRTETTRPAAELLRCPLTATSLQGSTVDLLLRPDVTDHVLAHLARVEYLGAEKSGDGEAHHFRGVWLGRRQVDFWIGTGERPVLEKFTSTVEVPVSEKQAMTLVTAATLTWEIGPDLPGETFQVQLPKGAKRVNDLMTALVKGGTDALIGRPPPDLALDKLGGGRLGLGPHKGKDVVVLFFWAGWCAPSTEQLPRIREAIAELRPQGLAVYTVNVGEKRAEVEAAVRKLGWQSPVLLDPEGKAAEAYGITALPVTVLVGRDGAVRAVHHGVEEQTIADIRRDVEALLAGEAPGGE